jgi:hypothetical protein
MNDDTTAELKAIKNELAAIRSMVEKLSPTRFNVPVSLTRAAKLCEMNRDTLLDWVQRKEIPAYRPSARQPWMVIPADVLAYLTRENNQGRPRRKSVLRGNGR